MRKKLAEFLLKKSGFIQAPHGGKIGLEFLFRMSEQIS